MDEDSVLRKHTFKDVLCTINEDIPDRCPFGADADCSECGFGQDGFKKLQQELMESICTFNRVNGVELNYEQTITRSENIKMLKKEWKFLDHHFNEFEEMSTEEIPWAYVKMRYPHLEKLVRYKRYRRPHKYYFKDDNSPLIAVYEGVVYTVAPRIPQEEYEDD